MARENSHFQNMQVMTMAMAGSPEISSHKAP